MQIIDYLKEKINKDEFALNQQLPTEKDLAEKFNVSRITSKRAMEELEREGLIVRKRGSGSFLLHKKNSINNKINDEKNKMNVVALIIPFGGSLGRGMDLIQGLSEVLNKNSYFLTVHISNQDSEEERRIITNLIDSGVRGIILYPVSHRKNIDLISRLLLDSLPFLMLQRYAVTSLRCDSAVLSNPVTNLRNFLISFNPGIKVHPITGEERVYTTLLLSL